MIDNKYSDYSRLLRMPELRMLGVRCRMLHLRPSADLRIDEPGMACFYYLRSGRGRFYPDAARDDGFEIEAGTSIGAEDGKAHRWTTSDKHAPDAPSAPQDGVEILMGAVDRRHTVIQKLTNTLVIMPGDAQPYASIVRHCVEGIAIDMQRKHHSDALIRRFSEIIQLEMLHYADSRLEMVSCIPDSVRRDGALLRAWTSFLADPAKPWTVAGLASVAGLGRTAFFNRFQKALGSTPLAMVRQTRIRYAADMLRSSQAPVAEIALRVGYGSDVAFIRAFRQEMATTPAHWRTAIDRGHV